MDIKLTKKGLELFRAAKDINKHTIISYGGSSSSKTYSVLQFLIIYSLQQKKSNSRKIVVVSQTYTKAWSSVISDFKTILGNDFYRLGSWSGMTYTFHNKTNIQFKTGDDEQKFRGPRQDILFFDEVNTIKENVYVQGSIRTSILVISTFNPTKRFWIESIMTEESTAVIHSTYKDNPFVPDLIVKRLNQRAERDKNFKRCFVDGEWGMSENLVFEEDLNFFIVNGIPHVYKEWKRKFIYGSDFGFQNDPSTLMEIVYMKSPNIDIPDKMYIKEHLYKTKQTYKDYGRLVKQVNPKNIKIIIDNAGTAEFVTNLKREFRINIEKISPKPRIAESLSLMKTIDILIDESSLNTIEEFRNLSWKVSKEGEILNEPIPGGDHAIDAIRYAFITLLKTLRNNSISVTSI